MRVRVRSSVASPSNFSIFCVLFICGFVYFSLVWFSLALETPLIVSLWSLQPACAGSSIEKANEVIEKGLVLYDSFTPVLPLSTPSKKIIVSNIPPFIKDELIEGKLQCHGWLVSSIGKIPLGCKSRLLKI